MCCLFGIYNYKKNLNMSQMNHILSVLSKESEARGTDATGIAYPIMTASILPIASK